MLKTKAYVSNPQILCFEPNQRSIEFKAKNGTYFDTDFAEHNFEGITPAETLCFFDDHYGWERVLQAKRFSRRDAFV